MAATRTSTGRKKIPIQKIENVDALHVCFSKRRHGLFKKAGELSILCGVEIAIIVFSPTGKVYSFGHPSVDAVIERFLQFHPGLRPLLRPRVIFADSVAAGPAARQADPHRRQTLLQELNRRHAAAVARVEAEKNRNAALQEQWKQYSCSWRECNIYKKVEDMDAEEAEAYRAVLTRLVDMVKERRENLLFANRRRPPVLSSPSTPTFFDNDGDPTTVTTPGDCGAVSIDTRQGWII